MNHYINAFFATSLLFVLFLFATTSPGGAGGVFGQNTLTKQELNSAWNESTFQPITSDLPEISNPSNGPAINLPIAEDPIVEMTPRPSLQTNGFVVYEDRAEQKTAEDFIEERAFDQEFGVAPSNICLTSYGACGIEYTLKGSSCFCGEGKTYAIGVAQ